MTPGNVIPDEVWEDADRDRAGRFCVASRETEHEFGESVQEAARAPRGDDERVEKQGADAGWSLG
jgi:hypothetical protein